MLPEFTRTLSVSQVLSTWNLPTSANQCRKVAMLHGRENLRGELEVKSIATCAFGTDNAIQLDNPFNVSRKESDGSTAVGIPPSIWVNTVKGRRSGDTFGIAQIQVDKKVVVSDI